MSRSKEAKPIWWQQLFPELPPEWIVEYRRPPAQGLAFINARHLEDIKLSFARLRGVNAIAQLNALLAELRLQLQELEASNLQTDEARRVASCRLLFRQEGQQLRGIVVVLSAPQQGEALILSTSGAS
ncbi:MAG: hypothetical protein IRZ31_17195 [Thermogemmatispora sp.]|uniref:hypothetical protein n=1 Tax=Thermogemmatispora sp. TaxID=1968838 RepID=UPI00261222CA|nr:hypothetical protein [Thermogemmatispora sp.]MBX5458630.1 hypothetical protein [Thermogemmatispora sp.]